MSSDTADVNVESIDELLAGWTDFVDDPSTSLSEWRSRDEAQVVSIMTLTAHVHATAMMLRPALPHGLTVVHMPLVRSIFEATITVVWCDEVADAADALVNDGAHERRGLSQALAASCTMRDMAERVSDPQWGILPTSSTEQAKNMKKRCDDVALDGAYAFYRMLSGLSHASIETIDAYLDSESFTPGQPMSVKSNPGPVTSSHAWTRLIACCLVWSGMVVNYLDPTRRRRDDLRRVARSLDTKPHLAVHYSAHQRGRRPKTK